MWYDNLRVMWCLPFIGGICRHFNCYPFIYIHVERMADDRLPKRAAELQEHGRRRRGRPRLRWEDCVKRDVRKAGEEEDWKKKTGDRVGWKRLSDEAVKKLWAAPHPWQREKEEEGEWFVETCMLTRSCSFSSSSMPSMALVSAMLFVELIWTLVTTVAVGTVTTGSCYNEHRTQWRHVTYGMYITYTRSGHAS